MSSRKNKVIIIFSIMLIAMNLFAVAQSISAGKNRSVGENTVSNLSDTNSDVSTNLSFGTSPDTIPNLNNWDLSINASRTIEVHDYGLLTVTDNFTIINECNITLPIFRFALPNEDIEQLLYIEAGSTFLGDDENVTQNPVDVTEEYKDDQFTYYIIQLNPAIGNESEYLIEIMHVYLQPYDTFLYIDGDLYPYTAYRMNLSGIPFIPASLLSCSTYFKDTGEGIILDDEVSPSSAYIGDSQVDYEEYENVPAYNFTEIYDKDDNDYKISIGGTFINYVPLEALNYKRTVTINNWYWTSIHEEITFKHLGIVPEDTLYDLADDRVWATFAAYKAHIWIDGAEDCVVYDELGKLIPDENYEYAQNTRINIFFRVNLYGGDTTTVQIDYLLSTNELLQYNKSEYVLNTIAIPRCQFNVRQFELTVELPIGADFQYVEFGGKDIDYSEDSSDVFLRIGSKTTITFTAYNISEYTNYNLKLGYNYNDLAYFIQPLTFTLVIFIACLLYVGIRVLNKDVLQKVIISTETKREIPIELIQDFVEKYEEKTALQARINELDEDRRKKKVKAKEYDQQRKILEIKMRETIKALDSTRRALKEQGRKYSDAINKIEVCEEKRFSIERNIQELRVRYIREKAISKDAYIRLLRDYQGQIEKFDRDIDKEIINLRLLIEHESKKD